MFEHIILGTLRYARPILSWFPSFQLSSQAFLSLSTTELLMFHKIISSHSFIHLFSRLSKTNLVISAVQFSCLVMSAWTAVPQASLFITNSRSLLKLISIESVMPSNHLILCCPLLFPPSITPSIRVFPNESVLPIRWPKY